MKRLLLGLLALLLVLLLAPTRYVVVLSAQGGMSKATAKLLVGDIIEAGYIPQIQENVGAYIITVVTRPDNAVSAADVQAFAVARGVTAKVTAVQFQ